VEISRSKGYSPSKKFHRQIFSNTKMNQQKNYNINIEKKKYIYQQSLQKLNKNNRQKSSQKRKNTDMNHYFKNNTLNFNNIPNNFKNSQNSSKTINNSKNKNYNTSLQKKTGSKSYVDLFQNNVYNSNDQMGYRIGLGRTISNSIYEKNFDFENNFNNTNNNLENNSRDYNSVVLEMNNIINILVNYINVTKKEYEKIIIKKVKTKDREIKKLQIEKDFLLKENKKLKIKILEIYYSIKTYENNKIMNKDKKNLCIKQLMDENIFLRKCTNKTNNINKLYFLQLENDISNQIEQKELIKQKIIEEEKNNLNLSYDNKDNGQNLDINNPFKFISNSNNNNNSNNIISHKRQKTQFKLGFSSQNENDNKMNDEEEGKDDDDTLSKYLNEMNNNSLLLSKAKNHSEKNLSKEFKLKKSNDNSAKIIAQNENNDNNLSNNISSDSIIYNKNNINNQNDENIIVSKEKNNISTDDKYSQRIEFTK
jgi:hypothetical protein